MKILMINGSEKNNKYQQIHKKIYLFLKENLKILYMSLHLINKKLNK